MCGCLASLFVNASGFPQITNPDKDLSYILPPRGAGAEAGHGI
jgi:hypothetical protein